MSVKQVLKIRYYKAGYEVHTELIDGSEFECDDFEIKSAYTIPEGHYIGDPVMAYRLCKKRGIKPEPRSCDLEANGGRGRTCTIGFSETNQKWYGWSHRALCGFGIGDVVTSENHLCATSGWTDEYLEEHPEEDLRLPVGFEAKTLEDAKRMAIAFADAVD